MSSFPIFDSCTMIGAWPERSNNLQAEVLLQVMKNNSISRSLVTATSGIFYDFRQGNQETLQTAQQNPQQFYPVGTIDPRAYPECIDEIERRSAEGFRFFRFFPSYQKWPINYQPFRELISKCQDLKVPVAIQAENVGDCTDLLDNIPESDLPVIISGVHQENIGEAISVIRKRPQFLLETTYLLGNGIIESLRDKLPNGANHLIFASFSPLRYLSSALGPIITSSLSDEEKALVLGGNLKKLLS